MAEFIAGQIYTKNRPTQHSTCYDIHYVATSSTGAFNRNIESSNRCGRKFRDAQAVLTLAGKARKRLLNNAVKMARSIDATILWMSRMGTLGENV